MLWYRPNMICCWMGWMTFDLVNQMWWWTKSKTTSGSGGRGVQGVRALVMVCLMWTPTLLWCEPAPYLKAGSTPEDLSFHLHLKYSKTHKTFIQKFWTFFSLGNTDLQTGSQLHGSSDKMASTIPILKRGHVTRHSKRCEPKPNPLISPKLFIILSFPIFKKYLPINTFLLVYFYPLVYFHPAFHVV